MRHPYTTRFANSNDARRIFICLSLADAKRFTLAEDREYFSKPVEVELVRTCILAKQMYVRDPHRNATYPVSTGVLKTFYQLSAKDRSKLSTPRMDACEVAS